MHFTIKKLIKHFIISIANTELAQKYVRKINKNKIAFLAYHGIKSEESKTLSWTFIEKKKFISQIKFIKKNYQCLSIDQAISIENSQIKKPSVVLTFDDGYANNYNIALPILEYYEIPAIIYVTTKHCIERNLFWPDKILLASSITGINYVNLTKIDPSLSDYRLNGFIKTFESEELRLLEDVKRIHPEKRDNVINDIIELFFRSAQITDLPLDVENNMFTPLTIKQIKLLSDHPLITIGAHSHCHNLLDQIPLELAEESIKKSKNLLEAITKKHVSHFAYPNGNQNDQLNYVVKRLGFKSAVTYKKGFLQNGDNLYTIKRFGISANTSNDLFIALLNGILR